MTEWTDEQLEEAGLDRKKVESIVRRFRKLSKELTSLDLHVYGASGSGNLVHSSRPTHMTKPSGKWKPDHGCVIASLGLGFDGGDW